MSQNNNEQGDFFRGWESAESAYDKHRDRMARQMAEMSAKGRDIGEIPTIADPERKEKCRKDFLLFCKTYFPEVFYLPWGPPQTETAHRIVSTVLNGGNFAIAMPRGTGKSSLAECAAMWAIFYGYRKFALIVCAVDKATKEILQSIKVSIETNRLINEDFPEICYPVEKIDGITNRCKGQLYKGKHTYIEWNDEKLVMPHIEGSLASGSIITSSTITGRLRGMKHKTPSGEIIRPDFVIIDDPQTHESAKSAAQVADRIQIIQSDILGLAGPEETLTTVMPCTVVCPNDVADQLLDREKYPDWNGRRIKLLDGWPKNFILWLRYWEIRANGMRKEQGTGESNDFYIAHRQEMDEGCQATWPERYKRDEISGIQYAMDLFFKNKQAFLSEYQNEPQGFDLGDGEQITATAVMKLLNNRHKGEIPASATRLTMFVDVQKNLLYYTIMAFDDDFTCWVIDYNAFPEQPLDIFTTKDAHPTYPELYQGTGQEGALTSALTEFLIPMLHRTFTREDGMEMTIDRCLIDSSWGDTTDAIYSFIKESRLAAILLPSKGMNVTATLRPISESPRRLGEIISPYEWTIGPVKNKRHVRLMRYDTNYWKNFLRNRVFTSRGDPGAISINGLEVDDRFRMLCDHLSSEYSIAEMAKGRRCDIWKLYPNRENHWLDCVVGCMVAASERGCQLLIAPPTASGKEARQSKPQAKRPQPKTYSVKETYSVGSY